MLIVSVWQYLALIEIHLGKGPTLDNIQERTLCVVIQGMKITQLTNWNEIGFNEREMDIRIVQIGHFNTKQRGQMATRVTTSRGHIS